MIVFYHQLCKKSAFFLHSPYELPLNIPYEKFTRLFYGTSMEILIKPEVIRADESLKEMDVRHRKCYFEDEYRLKYFKKYTKAHCDLEVLSDITFEKCLCVPFNYIRNQTMDVCDISKWPCAIALQDVVSDCLPLCDSISYSFETISSRIEHDK